MQSELGFPRTDGDSSLWPSNTRRIVDREGQVNYMHPLELDDPQCVGWREGLGRLVSEKIGLPAGPKYILRSWPEGYKMFVHYKGPQDNPRTDKYLFGSTLVKRFRSVPEFVLHAVWLMMDDTLQRSNCGCKYCTRTPQRGISQAAGLKISGRSVTSPVARIRQSTQAPSKAPRPPPQSQSAVVEKQSISQPPSVSVGPAETSPPPSTSLQENEQEQEQAQEQAREQEPIIPPKDIPWFAIRKEPKPVKPSTGPRVAMNSHRVADIEGMNSPHRRRFHRIGEVIWCFLDVPIAKPGEPDSAISAWPGIIKSIQRSMHVTIVMGESSIEHRKGYDQPYAYEVNLFNIDAVITISDERVLPYQAMSSPQPLLDALSSLMHTIDRKGHTLSVPAEGGLVALSKFTFEEAALPYALAVQAPIVLAKYWTCTDNWMFKYTITADKAVAAPITPPKKKHRTPGLHIGPMRGLEAPVSAGSSALPIEAHAQVKTQRRYQGLWWGGERIWVDDMVRLKVPRRELAANGSERVLPVVPPSQATIEYTVRKGIEPDHAPGSGDRGLFLRITSIFSVEKRVRISGMLFDLVEEGFVGAGVGGREGRREDTSAFDMTALDPALLQENTDAPPSERESNGFKPAADRHMLSGPYVRSWNPPEPPAGYKFRSILKGDWEAVTDTSLLSGRYYPGVLANPLLSEHLERLLRLEASVHHLYALEGIAPGYYNSVDPEFSRESRQAMLKEAVEEAKSKCEDWFDKEAVSNLLDSDLTSVTSDVEMGHELEHEE